MASRSVGAASIRCATYPPPPGSAPGYHVLHHCTASGTTRTAAAVLQSEKSGKSDSRPITAGWANSPDRPPTWGSRSATTAAVTDPTIAIKNWTKSVKTTPESPELAAYTTVTAPPTSTAVRRSQSSITPAILVAERLTEAMIITLKKTPR